MKYKNITSQTKRFKINENWVDLEPNSIIDVPESYYLKEAGLEKVTDSIIDLKKKDSLFKRVIEISIKSFEELKKMTKDEINDYSAKLGFTKEINSSMKKSEMIKTLMRLKNEKN